MLNYFRGVPLLMGRIFCCCEDVEVRSGRWGSWMRNKAGELSWFVECGSAPLLLLPFLLPLQSEAGTTRQLPKPLPGRQTRARKKEQKRPRVEWRKRKRVIWWPPLWEYCKLCFPQALGIPQHKWNLWAWKTGSAPLPPPTPSGDMSNLKGFHLITQCGGAASDALSLLRIRGAITLIRKSK